MTAIPTTAYANMASNPTPVMQWHHNDIFSYFGGNDADKQKCIDFGITYEYGLSYNCAGAFRSGGSYSYITLNEGHLFTVFPTYNLAECAILRVKKSGTELFTVESSMFNIDMRAYYDCAYSNLESNPSGT